MQKRAAHRLLPAVSVWMLALSSAASAVVIDWTPIGNPGNACEPAQFDCYGDVPYAYQIGTYEVTNAQYAEFLNAKATSDPLALYSTSMGSSSITRSGVSGSFSYSAISGRENMPVSFVTFYDALRFANWLNNGQGTGSTETGSYTLLGGTPTPSNRFELTRNAGSTIVLPNEDEWYKAAYHNALGLSATDYFDYPTGSSTPPTCSAPTATANRASCGGQGNFAIGGSYTGSASPYGTFDQGGNAFELIETSRSPNVLRRGGYFNSPVNDLAASSRLFVSATSEFGVYGFRIAMVPEPGTGLLLILGLVGLARARRHRI